MGLSSYAVSEAEYRQRMERELYEEKMRYAALMQNTAVGQGLNTSNALRNAVVQEAKPAPKSRVLLLTKKGR